jgi:hypothetical protein
VNGEALALWGLLRHKKKNRYFGSTKETFFNIWFFVVKILHNTELNCSLFGGIHVNTPTSCDFINLFKYILSRQLKLNCKLT